MSQPSTAVSRLAEKQSTSRSQLDELLDSTPLATIAFVRDGHPVALPIGFARIANEVVIHGSTGSPWLRQLAGGAPAAVSVTTLDGVVVARSGFESSFHYRSAVVFGTFEEIDGDKVGYLETVTDMFIPGRVAELRASNRREIAATMVLMGTYVVDTLFTPKIAAFYEKIFEGGTLILLHALVYLLHNNLLTWISLRSTTAKGVSFLKSGKVTALQGNGGKVTGVVVETGATEQQTLPADLVVVRD